MTLIRELNTPDACVNLAMDGIFVCSAGQTCYSVYNINTGGCQELLPCDPSQSYPHIKRVVKVIYCIKKIIIHYKLLI